MEEILSELKDIKLELEQIKLELKQIKNGTEKLENHINFVDTVYDQVKAPFHYMCDTIKKVKMIGD